MGKTHVPNHQPASISYSCVPWHMKLHQYAESNFCPAPVAMFQPGQPTSFLEVAMLGMYCNSPRAWIRLDVPGNGIVNVRKSICTDLYKWIHIYIYKGICIYDIYVCMYPICSIYAIFTIGAYGYLCKVV